MVFNVLAGRVIVTHLIRWVEAPHHQLRRRGRVAPDQHLLTTTAAESFSLSLVSLATLGFNISNFALQPPAKEYTMKIFCFLQSPKITNCLCNIKSS